jgi:hypothetical protein
MGLTNCKDSVGSCFAIRNNSRPVRIVLAFLFLGLGGGTARALAGATIPVKANDFLNGLGADTHVIQGIDSPQQVIAALRYTGLRNIRDDATHDSAMLKNLCDIHYATGAMIDELPIVDSDPDNIRDTLNEYEFLAACGALLAAEGPNEPNNFNFNYLGQRCSLSNSFGPCAQYQAALYEAVKSDPKLLGKQVWSLTEPGAEPDNQGLQFLTIPTTADTVQPAGTIYADSANLHNYVRGNGQGSIEDNQAWNAEATGLSQGPWDGLDGEFLNDTWLRHFPASPYTAGPAMPKVTTETGWPTDGSITEDQQGKLFTNLFLSARKLNWSYTFIYMMFDEAGQGNYGLFASNADGTSGVTPKLSATYIHNMTAILGDTNSEFVPTALDYTIPDEPATVHDLLLEKSNGTYELAIWADQIDDERTNVTLDLGGTFVSVNLYDITVGTTPTAVLKQVKGLALSLTDHAIFLEFRRM